VVVALEPGEVIAVAQGVSRHCGDRLDGRHALSAAAVRLSLRSRDWLEAVRNLQADGASAAARDHQSGDDRDLGAWCLAGVGPGILFGRLAARQTRAGARAVCRTWPVQPLGARF